MTFTICHGDCREVMATLDAESVDSVVCDPPYGLSFMGKGWDHGVPGVEFWTEALRVAKPGAHLLAFGGTRTYHRLACAIEDAGWEIRDCVMWVYGSGFPKSHDVSKAIDKAAGAEREVVGSKLGQPGYSLTDGKGGLYGGGFGANGTGEGECAITAPATDAARQWSGWGTALKPAWEPIIVARKPLAGTVAENVLAYGTGGINVDGCRVGIASGDQKSEGGRKLARHQETSGFGGGWKSKTTNLDDGLGRWPANLIHDGSEEVVGLFPQANGNSNKQLLSREGGTKNAFAGFPGGRSDTGMGRADSGSAARFFYCAKASKADRDAGCEGLPLRKEGTWGGEEDDLSDGKKIHPSRNHHPTVKPTALMRYLCRLVTPPGGVVLDPFTGSGSTGKAAVLEGFRFIGIEREAQYVEIARARIAAMAKAKTLF
jgi:DNA modification methylase